MFFSQIPKTKPITSDCTMNCDLSVKWSGRHWANLSKPHWQ